jgi:hypothetical protein
MVHEGAEPKGAKNVAGADKPVPVSEVIKAAVELCSTIIKQILLKGEIPSWKLFDIQA